METRIRNAAGLTMLVTTSAAFAQGTDTTAAAKVTPVTGCASCPPGGNVPAGHIPPDPYTIVGVAVVAFAIGYAVGKASGGKNKSAG